jgi:hypothetical protein
MTADTLIKKRKEREWLARNLEKIAREKRLEKRIREVMPDKPLKIGSVDIL